MAKNMRQEILEQRRVSSRKKKSFLAGVRENLSHLPISGLAFSGALLIALLVSVPSIWLKPLPYHLGYVAQKDIRSRLDFSWDDPNAEMAAFKRFENNHARIYREEFDGDWRYYVLTPVVDILEDALENGKVKTILASAAKAKIKITPEQAKIIVNALQDNREKIRIYSDIIDPMRSVLDERIFARSVMSTKDMEIERRLSKSHIQVRDSDHVHRRISLDRSEAVQIPLTVDQTRTVLSDRFGRQMMWVVPRVLRETLVQIIMLRMRPTLTFDEEATVKDFDQRRSEILKSLREVHADEVIVSRGASVTFDDYRKLVRENNEYRTARGNSSILMSFFGKFILSLTISCMFLAFFYGSRIFTQFRQRKHVRPTVIAIAACLSLVLLLAHLSAWAGIPGIIMLLPVGLCAAVAVLVMGTAASYITIVSVGALLMVVLEGQVGAVIALGVSSAFFARMIDEVRNKLGLLRAASFSGIIAALLIVVWGMSTGGGDALVFDLSTLFNPLAGGSFASSAIWLYFGWLITGVIVIASFGFAEKYIGATTAIQLADLQDQDHPCLRQMLLEAPNTYHHCMIVGTLAEAGAQAIGANALLAKVGSFYHDIGKLMKPEYFTENETGASRHDNLSPQMSTLIILSHVKDGVEMGKQYGLPPAVLEIIEQHHGQSLVKFFLFRAQKQTDGKVDESTFRYPGPRPQSREAAVVLLADSVEAASRSLTSSSAAHLRKLVHEIFMDRLLDGQLADCELDLKQLELVESAFVRILASMLHSRVKYPGQEKKRR